MAAEHVSVMLQHPCDSSSFICAVFSLILCLYSDECYTVVASELSHRRRNCRQLRRLVRERYLRSGKQADISKSGCKVTQLWNTTLDSRIAHN